jgi:alpha-N-arabinofuranosidase
MHQLVVNPGRVLARRDPMIYGQFLEHFHRQIYGGVYEPGSPLSDGAGFRTDVLDALRKIQTPVIRWPGGCFVSSYDWKRGVGPRREPVFDKAWRVEEPNTFGTDEFYALSKALDSEMYICGNAGTGTMEEMSDWLEYTNLESEGRFARWRIENGFEKPFGVKYFSVGNENYGHWELGAKERFEWARLVAETAKLLKRVDPTVQLSAAALPDPEWNLELIKRAGPYLDWISVHEYWDAIHTTNALASYEQAMAYTEKLDDSIRRVEGILAATGYLGKISIAFDEWNLRGWYHPNSHEVRLPSDKALYIDPRDKNDDNSSYTMADTVFTACFLNALLRHAETVRMANYAPAVNTRGLIYTHKGGIVLRGTYHVFDLFVNQMGDRVVDLWAKDAPKMRAVAKDGREVLVDALDAVATLRPDGAVAVSLVNKRADGAAEVSLELASDTGELTLYTIAADSVSAYNDVDASDRVRIASSKPARSNGSVALSLPPHSVSVLVIG